MGRMRSLGVAALLALTSCGGSGTGSVVVADAPSEAPAAAPDGEPLTLLFATKSGTHVSVRALDTASGEEETVLAYDERAPARHSLNLWEELAPSVDLARDGRTLAYAAADGLHVHDLETRSGRALISRARPGDDDSPPTWSPDLGRDTYALHVPGWSPDGRYLGFVRSHFEGSSIAFYDVAAGRPFAQAGLPAWSYTDPALGHLAWAAGSASTVVPQSGTESGLVLSKRGDPAVATLIPEREAWLGDAALSPDAGRVAFTFAAGQFAEQAEGLATMRRDGSGRQTVDESGAKSAPSFDAAGSIWWLESGALLRWDDEGTDQVARLDAALDWEILSIDSIDERGIELAGRSRDQGRARFVLLDGEGETLYEHDSGTDFTTYLELSSS